MLEASSDEDPTRIKRREGGEFEQRVASDEPGSLQKEVRQVIKKTIMWPSTQQTVKGIVTGGVRRTWRYVREKVAKYQEGKRKGKEEGEKEKAKDKEKAKEKEKKM